MLHALRPMMLLTALHVALLAPTYARADEPVAEFRAPTPPSSEITAALEKGIAKLPEDLRASFPAVVDGARSRWRAGQEAATDGSGSAIRIDEAARAAVLAVDFGGATKRKSQLEAMVRLTVLQLTVDLHAALREELGRRLAVRAVKKCRGSHACLDKIAPTATMPERQVTAVRAQFGSDTAALTAAELASAKELEVLGVMYSTGIQHVNATLAQNSAETTKETK